MFKALLQLINPVAYFTVFKEILKSLKHPTLQEEHPWSLRVLRMVFMVFMIALVFKVAGLFINQWVENQVGFDHKESKKMSPFILIVFGGLIAPALEELIFRLPNRFNALNISISTALLVAVFGLGSFINGVVKNYVVQQELIAVLNLSAKLVCALIMGVFLFLMLRKHENQLVETGQKNVVWIFYTYAVLFGFAHILNFQITLNNLVYIVPLTLPQIFGGLFLGYTRINYGIKYSILQHACWNLLVSLPALLTH